jgi:hypothetical protein
MASAQEYAQWIVQNQDKQGTPEFDTVAKAYQLAKQQSAPSPGPEVPSPGQAALVAGGYGLDKMAAGLRAATPQPIRNGIDWLNNKLGMGQPPSIDPQERAQSDMAMRAVENAYPLTSGLAESATQMAGGPLGMAAMAGLSYGTPQEKALAAGGAFAGGKLGELGGKAIGRIAQPIRDVASDAVSKAQELFSRYGANPLPSQLTGSAPLAWAESVASKLPGGGPVRAAVADQQTALNKAYLSAMGGDGARATPEAVSAAMRNTGSKFETIPAGQSVALDAKVGDKLSSIESDYMKNLSPDQKGIVQTYLDEIRGAGDSIPGEIYQKWRSRISARAAGTQDSELKGALTGIYKTLDDAFNRSATGTAAADYATARAQYSTGKKLGGLASVGGDVSPARLATAAKNLPGAGGDLAELGFRMKGLPDSGTAQRLFYQNLLGGGGLGATAGLVSGDPRDAAKGALAGAVSGVALPYAASKALTSPAFQRYLSQGLLNMTPELERELMLSGQLGGGLLGQRLGR